MEIFLFLPAASLPANELLRLLNSFKLKTVRPAGLRAVVLHVSVQSRHAADVVAGLFCILLAEIFAETEALYTLVY